MPSQAAREAAPAGPGGAFIERYCAAQVRPKSARNWTLSTPTLMPSRSSLSGIVTASTSTASVVGAEGGAVGVPLNELDDVDDVAEPVVEDRDRVPAGHERLDLGRVLALDLVEVLLGVHEVGGAPGQQAPAGVQPRDLEEGADDVRVVALPEAVPADAARRV